MKTFDLAGASDLPATELAEMREELGQEARLLMDATSKSGPNNEQLERLSALNDKMKSIDKIYAARKDAEASKPIRPRFPSMADSTWRDDGSGRPSGSSKSLGDIFTDSPGWRTQTGNRPSFAVNFGDGSVQRFLKAAMTTTVASPDPNRLGVLVLQGTQPPNVLDYIPIEEIRGGTIDYLRETSFTNAANVVNEGVAKPEASLALSSVPVTPRMVAVHQGVTRQTLQDVQAAREFVNSRLTFMVRAKAEQQVISGTGAAGPPQQIRGYLSTVGIQTETATGAGSELFAVAKAINKVRVNGFTEPTAIVMHPTNFLTIQTTIAATGELVYQHPALAGPRTLWGVPLILTTGIALNTALVGDFTNFSRIYSVGGVTSEVGFAGDDFIENLLRFLVELRLDLAVFRPAAFCQIVSLT